MKKTWFCSAFIITLCTVRERDSLWSWDGWTIWAMLKIFNIPTKKFCIIYKHLFNLSFAPVCGWNPTPCAAKKEQFKFSWQCFLNRALFSTRRTFQIHPDLTGGSSEGFEVAWQKKRQPILRTKLRLLQGVASFVTIRTPFPMNLVFVLFK